MKTVKMLPAIATDFPDTQEEQLLQYIINCNAEFKVAPAYTFYLCALRRLATNENNLVQFLEKVALSINRKTENITEEVEYAFWLANASELLHFLKYDKCLLKYSESAQRNLTTTIQFIFYRLLTHYMHEFEAATRDRSCLDKVICSIKATTTTLEKCWVNVAFINQLLSFLLQWMCRNLISNIEDPSSYYEYFKQLKYLAKSVDDQHLLENVMEFDCLIENADQNGQKTNSVNCIRLNWRAPTFLEYPAGEYNTFLEKTARLLTQIKSEKIQLKENSFALRLLIPYHGYSCDDIKNIPDWLCRFLNPIQQNGWCTFQKQSHSLRNWNVYMEGPKVEYCYLEKVKFYIPQHIKHRKARGVHVTSHTLATSNLVVGDVILSINDKTLIGITQQEAETIVGRSLDIVKLEVMKMNSCEVFLEAPSNTLPTSQPLPNKTTPEQDNILEQTVTFNLVENNTLRTKENVSQNVQPEQKQFFVNIRKEIDQLDNMLENFSGISENDRNYEYMKEIMMRNIIKLDNMDTGRNQEVKEIRRDTIYFIQDRMEQLKIKLKENQEKSKPPSDDSNVNYKKNESDDVNSSIKSDVPRENVASHEAIPKTIDLAEPPVAESGNSTKKLTTGSTAGTSNNQQIQNDLQLVYESKFSLNKYATKSISTGILPTSKQNMAVVKISVGSSTHIVLRVEDWLSLIKFECLLHQYFNSQSLLQTKEEYNKFPTKVFGNYTLCFLTSTKSQKFVEIKCNNDYIYLEQESVEKLLQLRVLISFRLEAIERTCFDDWLQWITAAAVQFSGDPLSNIQNLISNEANNIGPLISSLILEYIHLYPEITKNNVETKRRLFAKQQKTDQK